MLNESDLPNQPYELPSNGLPQQTISICPECLTPLPAKIYENLGRVWMRKRCEQHGEYTELISSDVEFFRKMDRRERQTESAIENPITASQGNCPHDCGLCDRHISAAMLIVIDITNRCNLRCPVCFADAAATGRVQSLTLEQVREMIKQTFTVSPVAPPCLQFSGGEPTIHPEFIGMIQAAREAGYAQIQAGTNGLRFAQDPAFARASAEAGLNVVYLQFDGVDDHVYLKMRGRQLWEIKNRAVENIQQAGMEICLVPTLAKGVNDHQVGDIFRFALDHLDSVIGISWQPVAFTGRIDFNQRFAMRFTLADLARELDQQTGGTIQMYRDWYPLSFVSPFSKLLKVLTGEAQPTISCHSRCGVGNYILADPETKKVYPLTSFVDLEGLVDRLDKLAELLQNRKWFKKLTLLNAMKDIDEFFTPAAAPSGWAVHDLLEFMNSFAVFRKQYPDNRARLDSLRGSKYRSLLMMGMHFQDVYNYEIPRTQRCIVQYIAADGRMYPFCTYNSGPAYRRRIEERFSWPERKLWCTLPSWNKYRTISPPPRPAGNPVRG